MIPPNPGALFPPPPSAGSSFLPPQQFFSSSLVPGASMTPFSGMPSSMPPPLLGSGYPPSVPMSGMGGMYPPQEEKKDTLKKLFVKNVNELIADVVIEKILREFGELRYWKRAKNQKNEPMSFGYCEFTQIEAVLRCIRILNNYEMFEKSVQVKPDEKTENFIKEWMELKRNQLELTQEGKTVESLFEKEDAEVKERLKRYLATVQIIFMNKLYYKIDFRRIKDEKFREEQNKEHYRERERESRRRQYMRDIERKFNEKLKEWLRRDENKQKDLKKLREKERQKFREKDKLLEKELECNSADEKQKLKSMPYKYLQKKKRERKKEREEDEAERKRQYEQLHPPEPEMRIFRPEDTQEYTQEYKNVLMSFQSAKIPLPPGVTNPKASIQQTNFLEEMDIEKESKYEKYEKDDRFDEEDDEPMMEKPAKKHKSTARITESTVIHQEGAAKNQHNIQIDFSSKKATVNLQKGVSDAFNQGDDDMEVGKEEPKQSNLNNLVFSKKQVLNEDIKKEFEKMIKQIPTNKSKLYAYPINWALFAKSGLLEKKVKAWLAKKSIEYIGAEEETFISMIYKKILSQEAPEEIEKKVEKVLDEDAADFVVKMWRMIIFELLKVEAGLA